MLGGPLERSGFPPPSGGFTPSRCSLFLLRRSQLEKTAHAGKSRLVDHVKAALVRYVVDATGLPHDVEVSDLLEAALEPLWKFDDVGQFTRIKPEPWGFPYPENHRKWRARHAELIKEDSALRQAWFREADAEGKRVATARDTDSRSSPRNRRSTTSRLRPAEGRGANDRLEQHYDQLLRRGRSALA